MSKKKIIKGLNLLAYIKLKGVNYELVESETNSGLYQGKIADTVENRKIIKEYYDDEFLFEYNACFKQLRNEISKLRRGGN